jgi:hypothetical protein
MDFKATFSVFSVDEEGNFLLLLVGTNFEVLKRANLYSSTDFLDTKIEEEFWDSFGCCKVFFSCWKLYYCY